MLIQPVLDRSEVNRVKGRCCWRCASVKGQTAASLHVCISYVCLVRICDPRVAAGYGGSRGAAADGWRCKCADVESLSLILSAR